MQRSSPQATSLGDSHTTRSDDAWSLLAYHGFLWLLLAALIAAIPRWLLPKLADFGVDLPVGTIVALQLIDASYRGSAIALSAIAIIIAIDASILLTPHDSPRAGLWLRLWFLGLPLLLIAALTTAFAIPITGLHWRMRF